MSTESILTLVGIGVTVVIFLLSLVVAVVGFLLSRQLRAIESELSYIRPLEIRIVRLEAMLGLKRPSDVVRRQGETPA